MNTHEGQLDACFKNVHISSEQMNDDVQVQPSQSESGITLLPLEIWDTILGRIYDPKDILSCCDVCYDWYLLLQPRMTSAYFKLILPKLVPYLGINDLLNCSTVSKTWTDSIDIAVLNFRDNALFWSQDTRPRLPFLMMHENEDVHQIEQFLEEKEEFEGNEYYNPLAYRHVAIHEFNEDDMDDEVFDAFCRRLLSFLQRFGTYIYQLELLSSNEILGQMIQILGICLSNTPNLKVLMCDFGTDYDGNDGDAQDVDDYIAASPLPNSSLRKLRLECVPTKIVDVLAERYGNQLVYVHDFFEISVTDLIPKGVTFQNMQILRGSVYGSTFSEDETNDLDSITDLVRNLKWTLTEVDITLVGGFEYSALSFANFFQALHEHQPQIQTFQLSLSPVGRTGTARYYTFPLINLKRMVMPNLKRLTLDQVGIPPLQFFHRATPELEHLTIYNREKYEWNLPDERLDDMWKSLPKCKMIRMSNTNGTDGALQQHTDVFQRY